MFSNCLNVTNAFSNSMEEKVICYDGPNHWMLDKSFYMTATILLHNRVENLKLMFTASNDFSFNDVNTDPKVYSFHFFKADSQPDEHFKLVEKYHKIEKLPAHEKFLTEQLKQPVFIRLFPEINAVCFFINEITYPVWHSIQVYIPKYFRVFVEKPLTKEEKSFLETLTYKTSKHYIDKIQELTNTDSFSKFRMKFDLESFEKKIFKQKIANAKKTLSDIEIEMAQAMDSYKKACEKRFDAMAMVAGLETMESNIDEHTELQDYLINNPRICNLTISNTQLSFIVKTYLAPHHLEEWDTISKRNQIFERFADGDYAPKDIKLLLDAIFSENRCLKLRMCAFFNMDYFGGSVESYKNYDYVDKNSSLKDYIPNPHLNIYNCFGQNKEAILEQLKTGDAVGAIECAIACAQRVNIHESMTFNRFIVDLLNFEGKCLVTEDGKEFSPKEAIAYLKGQNDE